MKTISFVIPVYNEEKRLNKTFSALERGLSCRELKLEKIIFVDDGSNDNTKLKINSEKLRIEKILNAKVKIISYKQNTGKGYAVKTGMLASNSDYTLFFDADMSTPLTEIRKFIPSIKKNVDIIIGTRKNGHSTVIKHQPLYREILGRGFTLLSNLILNTWVTDFTCGFKMISRQAKNEIFLYTKVNRWSYDAEIILLAKELGYNIKEIPVCWSNDERTKVNLLKDLPETLIDLISIRLSNFKLKDNLYHDKIVITNINK